MYAKAKRGESKYKAFFFPFYASAYQKQFKYDIDLAEKWYRNNNKGRRLSKNDLDKEELALYEQGCNLRMLMWRRYVLQDREKNEFYQEHPATDTQAFISTGESVFDQGKILERLNYLTDPLSKDELSDLPEVLKPYVGKSLFIFHLPKSGKRYYGGVDVSSGSGSDLSAVTIIDEDGEQVASFYNNKVAVFEFAKIVDALGKYFNYAFLCVERNGFGLPLLERLRKDYGYLNLFKMRTFDSKGKKKTQLGWTTSHVTKSIMVADGKEMFELGLVNINCRETLEQMQIFVEKDGKTGNKRGEGNRDDCVISYLLACQAWKTRKYYVEV
ncbi:hypothetical protein BSNK01_00010 [Bacillaceae bacterium]